MKVCEGCLRTEQEISRQPCGSQRCPGLSEMTLEQLKHAQDRRHDAAEAMAEALKTLDSRATKP